MSVSKSVKDIQTHKAAAIEAVSDYLDDLLSSADPGKADKFSYWLEDYVRFLRREDSFLPTSLKRYKRGEIIKVHLGYNIGSEEGGLHYAVVLDKKNSIHNPVLTVLPLTSIKNKDVLTKLGADRINLGNELYISVSSKRSIMEKYAREKLEGFKVRIKEITSEDEAAAIYNEIKALEKEITSLEKTAKELSKMKSGSLALIGQITTVSKIRIYDPKTSYDVLHGVRLSNEKLDLIDEAIKNLYIGKKS